MTNILFVSDSGFLAEDLHNQISHYLPEFSLISPQDRSSVPDIILVDEQYQGLGELHQHFVKAPVFLLSSNPDSVPSGLPYTQLVSKPFSLDELFNLLRSGINRFENSEEGFLRFNCYEVRPVSKKIHNLNDGEIVKLTEKEVAVIKYLYKAQDRIVTKNELLQEVWGYAADATTHTIETHVYRLRQKVEHDNPAAQLIHTLDGGYQLKV